MRHPLNIRCWKLEQGTPTEPTVSPVHQKIHLDDVHTGFVPRLTKKNIVLFQLKVNLKQCFVILYCMANGLLRQLVYSMYWISFKLHNSLKWVR